MQNHTTNSLINTIEAFSNAEPPPVRILGDKRISEPPARLSEVLQHETEGR